MPQRWLGYDQARVDALGRRVATAADHFDGITSDDAAAAGAIATIRRISMSLRTTWLPAVTRVGADTSMTAWASAVPAPPNPENAAAVAAWWESLSDAQQLDLIANAPA